MSLFGIGDPKVAAAVVEGVAALVIDVFALPGTDQEPVHEQCLHPPASIRKRLGKPGAGIPQAAEAEVGVPLVPRDEVPVLVVDDGYPPAC